RVLASDLVAQPSEQKCSQWTDQESGREKCDRAQQRRNRVALLEEFDSEDRGQAAEDIEVIPFDDIANGGGNDHASKVPRNFTGHSALLAAASPGSPLVGPVLRPGRTRSKIITAAGPSL